MAVMNCSVHFNAGETKVKLLDDETGAYGLIKIGTGLNLFARDVAALEDLIHHLVVATREARRGRGEFRAAGCALIAWPDGYGGITD
jgi:hypothetical protein